MDFETDNKDFGDSRLRENGIICGCWKLSSEHPSYYPRSSKYEVVGGEYDHGLLVKHIEEADFIVAHNAKFELGWLERCGLDLRKVVVFCTQIGEYVIAGNRNWGLTLEACCTRRRYGHKDFVGQLIRRGVDPRDIPIKWLVDYCHKDVKLTEKLFKSQRRTIFNRKLEPTMYTRCLLTPALVGIERMGMCVDKERVDNIHFHYAAHLAEAERELNELTAGLTEDKKPINFKSPKQVGEFLYDILKFPELKDYRKKVKKTASGNRLTDKGTLEALAKKCKTQRQKKFIELKLKVNKYNDAMSKTLSKFKECVDNEKDGILYANLNQTIAQTHRLTSSGTRYKVQFQNIDRQFKPLIKRRKPGWIFCEHDFAQLEYRTAVWLGNDSNGRKDIKNKVDAHGYTASIIFGGHFEEPKFKLINKLHEDYHRDKKYRQDSKPHTFKPLYGGQSGTEAEKKYYRAFAEKHDGITEQQEQWKSKVERTKQLRIPSGLIFYWPNTFYSHSGYLENTTAICNYPVQSFATADIVPISVVYLWHRLATEHMEAYIVNTIHDSVLAEVPEAEEEKYDQLAKVAMEKDTIKYVKKVYGQEFDVPLEGEYEPEEGHKENWNDYPGWIDQFVKEVA